MFHKVINVVIWKVVKIVHGHDIKRRMSSVTIFHARRQFMQCVAQKKINVCITIVQPQPGI